jgi:Flp pilus assembly pilin Flp
MQRLRDSRGQTAAEYLGVLLVVVAVVAAVSHAGVAQAVAGDMQRAVCRIGGGGTSCGAAAAGGRNGPELPGAPGGGPAFGSIPYVRPGISWDGSIEVEGKGGITVKQGPFSGGAWVKAQIERERTACRLDENGRAVVDLRVKGTLEAGNTVGAEKGPVSGSQDSYAGASIGWDVATDEDTADRIANGGELPTPADPASIPQGTAITLNDDFFAGLADHGAYYALKADFDIKDGKRLSSSVLRVDDDHVRITVGDSDLVSASTFVGLGGEGFGIGLAGSHTEVDGKARQIDLDISTPQGRAAYAAFVSDGRLPQPQGTAVTNRRDSEVYAYTGKQGVKVELGPLSLTSGGDETNIKSVRTLRPDGRFDVMTYDQDNDVSLVSHTVEDAAGHYGAVDYTLRLQDLDGQYVGLIQQDIGAPLDTSADRDVTLHYTDADLMRVHDLALAQVVADAHRNGVDVTPAQAQKLLQEGPLAGSDIAQGLARLSNPVDIMNYLNQQVARGSAAGFVENVERFVQDSRAEGETGHGFPAGAKFTAPQC